MAKGNAGGIVQLKLSPSRERQIGSAAQKREFLKRKQAGYGAAASGKGPAQVPKSGSKKSYRYYADNFDGPTAPGLAGGT